MMTDRLEDLTDDELLAELGRRHDRFVLPEREIAEAALIGLTARRQEIRVSLDGSTVTGFLTGVDEEFVQILPTESDLPVLVAWSRIVTVSPTGRTTSHLAPDQRRTVEEGSHTLWIKAKEVRRVQTEIRRRRVQVGG